MWTFERLYRVRCHWRMCIESVYGLDAVTAFYAPMITLYDKTHWPLCSNELYKLEQWYTREIDRLPDGEPRGLDLGKLVESMIEDIGNMDWTVKDAST